MNIECPRCKTMTIYDQSNQFRPFCSKRCQVMDTAAWAAEEYAVAGERLAAEPESEKSTW